MRSIICAALALSACTSATREPDGQLFCAVWSASGPIVVGLVNAEVPGAVIATGASKWFVDAACARIGGVPVAPPAGQVPIMAVRSLARGAG